MNPKINNKEEEVKSQGRDITLQSAPERPHKNDSCQDIKKISGRWFVSLKSNHNKISEGKIIHLKSREHFFPQLPEMTNKLYLLPEALRTWSV